MRTATNAASAASQISANPFNHPVRDWIGICHASNASKISANPIPPRIAGRISRRADPAAPDRLRQRRPRANRNAPTHQHPRPNKCPNPYKYIPSPYSYIPSP